MYPMTKSGFIIFIILCEVKEMNGVHSRAQLYILISQSIHKQDILEIINELLERTSLLGVL